MTMKNTTLLLGLAGLGVGGYLLYTYLQKQKQSGSFQASVTLPSSPAQPTVLNLPNPLATQQTSGMWTPPAYGQQVLRPGTMRTWEIL
jgi:hypothetical protein